MRGWLYERPKELPHSVSNLVSADEIRKTTKLISDDTYFLQITQDEEAGPFAEFHGDPLESDRIAAKLDQLARSK